MAPKVAFGIAAVGLYASTAYASFHIYRIYQLPNPKPNSHLPENQRNFSQKFNEILDYDSSVEWDEYFMGLPGKRKYLTQKAYGDVLEVSAGTGRNLEYFKPEKISSLNIVDSSPKMLKTALVKFREFRSMFKGECKFTLMDSQNLNFQNGVFDSILDTFGLCSHEDPVKALKEMSRTCRKGGTILLLEHGRSGYSWINSVLDKTAVLHAEKWGCWWNRDIIDLVKQAGLEIVECKRFHFGTTYSIIAKRQ